jgi:hypothetical protein
MQMSPAKAWTALAIWIWGGLVLGFAIHGYVYPWSHTVYDIYAPAARHWWAGEELYAPMVKEWWDAPGVPASTTDYYRYCPLFAVAVTPFAILPDSMGNALWKCFNCLFFAFGLWRAGRTLFPVVLSQTQMALFYLLVLPTSLHSMYNGQANLVVVSAMLLGLSAAAEDKWNRAAGWLALATLIKGYPLALGLLMSALYPRRYPLRYGAAMLLGLVVPCATQRPSIVLEQTLSWWTHLSQSTVLMRERLRSLDKLLDVCQIPVTPQTFAFISLAAGALVLVLCRLHARRSTDKRERLTHVLMLFSTWVVLFGPATEACTYAVIAPAIGWALIDAFQPQSSWKRRVVLVASLLLMGPVATDMFGSSVRLFANRYGSQPMGGLLFLGCLVVEIIRGSAVIRSQVPLARVWSGSVIVLPDSSSLRAPRGTVRPIDPAWTGAVLPVAVGAPLRCPP